LNCHLKNSMHLARLAIAKSDGYPLGGPNKSRYSRATARKPLTYPLASVFNSRFQIAL
jgi:hypothetical protein